MYKLFFIARNNMKRQKGDMITFFILTFLAAFLIFDCAAAMLGMGKVLDDRFAEVNGPHVILGVGDSDTEKECATKVFEENPNIAEYEASPILDFYSEYKNAKESDWTEFAFYAEPALAKRKILNVTFDGESLAKEDIFIPYYMKTRFEVGDTLQMRFGEKVYDFHVAGYSETPYFTSTMNIPYNYVYLSQERIDLLLSEQRDRIDRKMMYKGIVDEKKLATGYTTMELEDEITGSYKSEIAPYSSMDPESRYSYLAANWQLMKGGSQLVAMIAMGIILLFAVLILTIALVIISFSIRNFIQKNMKNTGMLEASGYTVRELRGALMVQVLSVALLGSILGVGTAMATFGKFGNVVSQMLGLTWNQPVNIPVGIATIAGVLLVICLVSRVSGRIYQKISVLDALRGGIHTHNFKKNHFSFEKTPLPIPVVLSLKETVGGIRKNLLLTFIIIILTISTLIGFGLMDMFGTHSDNFVKMLGFEYGTIAVDGQEDIAEDLRSMDGVENVVGLYGIEPTIRHGDMSQTIYTYVYDDMKNRMNMVLLEGREARHDNEITLTPAAADDLGVTVGDVVILTLADKSEEYLVTGIEQKMERMGRVGGLTFEGAGRIMPTQSVNATYWVTGKEEVSFDDLKRQAEEIGKEKGIYLETIDGEKNINEVMATLNSAMKMICLLIAVITTFVVAFVEALIIRAKITREWRDIGISKALGMTSGQILSQIMLSNVPAIIAGILIGVCVSEVAGEKLFIASMAIFGIKKVDFAIPSVWQGVTALGILVIAVLTAGLLGLKTRKMKPVEMITEE